MRCPACREGFLQSDQLDDGPAAATCPACAGGFVRSADYHVWLKDHGENLPERPADEQSAMEVVDSGAGKLCPACDRFMTRVKVGHDVPFHLDFCANCGGVWLDAREWDVLRARNLHDEVHLPTWRNCDGFGSGSIVIPDASRFRRTCGCERSVRGTDCASPP